MAVLGDRGVASLLSALAEAPDLPAAASFLLAQLVDITSAPRALMLRLDPAYEALGYIASAGFDPEPTRLSIPLVDLSNPLVISALALVPVRGGKSLGFRALAGIGEWLLLPMSQPRQRGAPERMAPQRASELIASPSITVLEPAPRRLGVAPAGIVLFEGPVDDDAVAEAAEVMALADPIVSRIATLDLAQELADQLA
ncbi:MAG TPA: hypothetical protein VFJ20_15285, partial [Gemmatimonadaceae bacterium]|nr:hypothetical protein [Gemmatimonadaceae bacterium]